MKKCPQCGREYDLSMSYCLDDGAELLYGPASSDEPATAILHETGAQREAATQAQIYTTDRTVLPSGIAEVEKPRSFDKRILIAPVALAVIVLGGSFGYRYFRAADTYQVTSIAVLPFQNRGGDDDTDYLSDGIAESLIYRLSQLPDLKVSPVSSVIRYKGKDADVGQVARELEVDTVMSGRLTQRGENLAISVELIDARTKKILWGEQYDRKLSDLLTTQREIAAVIAQKLQLKLSGAETGLAKKYTNSSEAYQLYLKGRFHFARRSQDDMWKSIELFEQAIKLDPSFALAYVGLAESYTTIPSYPYASPAECMPKAKTAIAKALELDPDLPEAHTVAGMIAASYDWDYAEAERRFKRAIELGPDLAITHYRYGWTFLSPLGRHDEAIAALKRAMEIEPLSIQQGSNYAAVLMYAGRFDEALAEARKTYDLDPNQIGAQNWLCHALNAKGLWDEAIKIGLEAETKQPNTVSTFTGCLSMAYARTGQSDKSLEIISKLEEAEKRRYVMSYWIAVQHAALGDNESALAELEKGYENRDWFMQRLKTDPFMGRLRGDPRYRDLLKRLNLPE